MEQMRTEVADGMRIDWDVPIPMDDGVVLRADVYRPIEDGHYPVILAMSPYCKGLNFEQGRKTFWDELVHSFPEVAEGTTNKYQNWERVDPEKWVPDGYVCVRVDARGSGRSPGYIDPFSARETKDFSECIEWAGTAQWSNGRVGLLGISYHAMNQWQVAPLRPAHLAAICVWEGCFDFYREACRHGGILSAFQGTWYHRRIINCQHGVGDRGPRSIVTGETITGPETLSEEELAENRRDLESELLARPFDDEFYRERSGVPEDVHVPLLSSANWGGQGMHTRGNFEGFVAAPTPDKWLSVHGHTHFTTFYINSGIDLQKRFFGHFLKGEDTGWTSQPPVELYVRHPGEKHVVRAESEWPLARTRWTKFYLNPGDRTLGTSPTAGDPIQYEAMGQGVTFLTPPLTEETEITGPVAAKLFLSSDTTDADVFLVLHVFDPAGEEVTFIGSNDPRTPVGLGWLRASHRKLDQARSLPYRPYHTHDEALPLEPGQPVELDVEIWPTCVVVPAGYRIGLTILGRDYEKEPAPGIPSHLRGIGPFLHNLPEDRPSEIFGGVNTLHFPEDQPPYLLLPVIPD